MKTLKFFCLTLVMMCFFTGASNATTQKLEDSNSEISTTKERLFNLPPKDEIDPVLLEEMDFIYRLCVNDIKMSGHIDCKCHAMAFLEERIKTPSIPQGIVKDVIKNQCYSPEKMIGHYFGECMAKRSTKRRASEGNDPVEYCKCYAEETSRLILNTTSIGGNTMRAIHKRAEKSCDTN